MSNNIATNRATKTLKLDNFELEPLADESVEVVDFSNLIDEMEQSQASEEYPEPEQDEPIKEGYRTTEFWTTALTSVTSLVLAFACLMGWLEPTQSANVNSALAPIFAALSGLVVTYYNSSRTALKTNMVNANNSRRLLALARPRPVVVNNTAAKAFFNPVKIAIKGLEKGTKVLPTPLIAISLKVIAGQLKNKPTAAKTLNTAAAILQALEAN